MCLLKEMEPEINWVRTQRKGLAEVSEQCPAKQDAGVNEPPLRIGSESKSLPVETKLLTGDSPT